MKRIVKSVSVYAKTRKAAISKAKKRSHVSTKIWRVAVTQRHKGALKRRGMSDWEISFRRRGVPHFG